MLTVTHSRCASFGYANRGTVHRVVQQTLQAVQTENVQALRAVEVDRLDALQQALWDRAMGGNVPALRRSSASSKRVPKCSVSSRPASPSERAARSRRPSSTGAVGQAPSLLLKVHRGLQRPGRRPLWRAARWRSRRPARRALAAPIGRAAHGPPGPPSRAMASEVQGAAACRGGVLPLPAGTELSRHSGRYSDAGSTRAGR